MRSFSGKNRFASWDCTVNVAITVKKMQNDKIVFIKIFYLN